MACLNAVPIPAKKLSDNAACASALAIWALPYVPNPASASANAFSAAATAASAVALNAFTTSFAFASAAGLTSSDNMSPIVSFNSSTAKIASKMDVSTYDSTLLFKASRTGAIVKLLHLRGINSGVIYGYPKIKIAAFGAAILSCFRTELIPLSTSSSCSIRSLSLHPPSVINCMKHASNISANPASLPPIVTVTMSTWLIRSREMA